MSQPPSIAITLVSHGASDAPTAEVLAALLARRGPGIQVFQLGTPDAAAPATPGTAQVGEQVKALTPADLKLPPLATYPHGYAFDRPGCALAPWVALHLLRSGFESVICLDSACWATPAAAKVFPQALDAWLTCLDAHTDLCLSPWQDSLAVRDTPDTRHHLSALQAERMRLAQKALSIGQLVLVPDETPVGVALQGRVAIQPGPAESRHAVPASHSVGHEGQALWGPVPGEHAGAAIRQLHCLQGLYARVLQRQPDAASVLAYGHRVASPWGRLRLTMGLLRHRLASPAPHHTPPPTPTAGGAAQTGSAVRTVPQDWPANGPAPAGINLMGYVRAELGLGEAARSLAAACEAVSVDFSVVDLGYQTLHPQADYTILRQAKDRHYGIDLHYVNASHARQTAELLEARGHGRNAYTIGFWHWEQPEFPLDLQPAFAHVDEVWAPSTFVGDAIAAVSPVPVFKVPHAVTCEAGPQATRAHFSLPEDRLLVLVMYDLLSYQHRKNPEAAIAAFRLATRASADMGLVIKTINGTRHPQDLAQLKASVADLPHVHFVDDFLSRQATWDLQACCDVLLSLHRAEGFGLAPAEMMRLGKPVVATGWSANMDFMTAQNSMPVQYTLQPLREAVGAYPAGPLWAEADVDHAAWCLQRLASDPALRSQIGQQASHDIRTQLSPQTVGRQIRNRLAVLGHWYPALRRPPLVGSSLPWQA
jgi:glycosyltransferase involved in cell wall biosynthesis